MDGHDPKCANLRALPFAKRHKAHLVEQPAHRKWLIKKGVTGMANQMMRDNQHNRDNTQ